MREFTDSATARRIAGEAAHWLLANREGLDESGRLAFLAWLRHSPAHVGEYMAMAEWEQDMRDAAAGEPLTTSDLVALAATEPAVVALRPSSLVDDPCPARSPGSSVTARARPRRWAWVAAAAVLAFAAVAAWPVQQAVPGVVYAAPADATRSLELADGSRIQLDRDSSIRVHMNAGRRDIALLAGTMLIDVGHRSAAPLKVTLGRTVLRDIGTVFQVSAMPGGADVTVLSGRVDVMAPHGGSKAVLAHLERGQRASLATDGSLTHLAARADLARDLAWLPSEIDFRDQPVAEVARRFNDYGGAPVLVEDTELAATRISGRFHARDPAGFLGYLQTLPGIRIRRDAQGTHVVRDAQPARTARL